MAVSKGSKLKNSKISELKLKWLRQTSRFMNVFVWIEAHIGNQINVSVKTRQNRSFSEEAVFQKLTSQSFFRKFDLICLWVRAKLQKD